jgi:UTP--glucose-1-phosphate uridylyltransferase
MNDDGLPELAIRTFEHYFRQLTEGHTGLVPEADIQAVGDITDLSDLDDHQPRGKDALSHCLMIKLNGGLGTSMGLNRAKSLLPVRGERTFLDLIVQQVCSLRRQYRQYQQPLPLLLMNSFATHDDSMAQLAKTPALADGQKPLPLAFLQHRVPRLDVDTLEPVVWPQAPEREWCPPGHGDIYTALSASGLLSQLLDAGYRYVFVSNADNLGATLDLNILGWMADRQLPFVMEVTDRTPADRKGGHLAMDHQGAFRLRESAQCPPEELDQFQDITRYRYFNTNNLWIDLRALAEEMDRRDGILGLPIIRNVKHLVPEDPSTPRCVQVETAMGSALEVFAGAEVVRVPRSRFAPVKTTNDLLALRSDRFRIEDNGQVCATADQTIDVDLDTSHFGMLNDFERRFPADAPSLIEAERFEVRGDIRFGSGVRVRGRVSLRNTSTEPRIIPDGTVLDNVTEGG